MVKVLDGATTGRPLGDWTPRPGYIEYGFCHTDGDYKIHHHSGDKNRESSKTRCPYSETWFVRIKVKTSFIDSLRSNEVWFSHEWKEFRR